MFTPLPPTWEPFWETIDQLYAAHRVVIDRPHGSAHPRYPEMIYPLDYGYLEGTTSMDGGGIDVWVGSGGVQPPDALILSVDFLKKDAELKLMLGCTSAQKQAALDFMNAGSLRATLIERCPDRLDILRSRRSVRRFTPQPIPESLLRQVLEAVTWAPSAHNRQPWRLAVLTSPDARLRLAERMGADFRQSLLEDGLDPNTVAEQVQRSYQRILSAPAAILFSLDTTMEDSYPDAFRQRAERLMSVQSLAMAGENLLLAAHAAGLGGVWVCAPLFAPQAARLALDLPESWEPQGLVLLGYPAAPGQARPRRPLDKIAHFY
jgi:F420 biosynthesis protein FbiB-like protein